MNKELYSDGIGNIQLIGGMVRIDLVTLTSSDDGKTLAPERIQRLVLSPTAFLQSFDVMNQFTSKLVDAGFVKKTEPAKA